MAAGSPTRYGWRRHALLLAGVLITLVAGACRSTTVVRTKQGSNGESETTVKVVREAQLLTGDPRPLETVKQTTAPTSRPQVVGATPPPTSPPPTDAPTSTLPMFTTTTAPPR